MVAALSALLVIQAASDIEWKASGSLPPGAEYHLVYEDQATRSVETLVRFPAGYVLPTHSHAHDETLLVLKGKLEISAGDKIRVLGPGSYAVVPAGTSHSLRARGWKGCQLLVALNGPFDIKGLPALP